MCFGAAKNNNIEKAIELGVIYTYIGIDLTWGETSLRSNPVE